jgi:hypothetical protein
VHKSDNILKRATVASRSCLSCELAARLHATSCMFENASLNIMHFMRLEAFLAYTDEDYTLQMSIGASRNGMSVGIPRICSRRGHGGRGARTGTQPLRSYRLGRPVCAIRCRCLQAAGITLVASW